MILAAHQPQFAPWLGYFDKMARADVFVLLDDVQFKKNEWQNRNRIKGPAGAQWLTVPVSHRFGDPISEVAISDRSDWRRKHRSSLVTCYGRAPHAERLLGWYGRVMEEPWDGLLELNLRVIDELRRELAIETPVIASSSLDLGGAVRDERLIALCRGLGADSYLAGAGGRGYMDLERYRKAGIRVVFQELDHPVYPQRFSGFVAGLSAIDLVANCGPGAAAVLAGGAGSAQEEDHERSRDRLPSR